MKNERIWFALIEVKVLKGNEYIKSDGAFVNVACLAENKNHFKSQVVQYFENSKFQVVDYENIQNIESLTTSTLEKLEIKGLIEEIQEGYRFAWGTFHTFNH